jgi:spectinomycin phosphotransferase
LASCLAADFGLDTVAVTFLPIGHDAAAWVYRATTAGAEYFVKVRRSITNQASLVVPRYLIDNGVASVVAPISSRTGGLWATAGAYAVVVYPFVGERTGMSHGMSERQWRQYGAVLRSIHDTLVTPELATVMRRETFRPDGADVVRRLDDDIATGDFKTGNQATVAAFWRLHRDEIVGVLAGAERRASRIARSRRDFVLCHADIHTNNVLIDPGGTIWIVDWDETLLAPRERDLMFVLGGGIGAGFVGARNEALFREGYGDIDADALALAYYRAAWAVSDIAAYGEQVFYRPDLGPQSALEAVHRFQVLFAPGNIVSLARASQFEQRLPVKSRERGVR